MACKRSGVRIPIAPPRDLHVSVGIIFTFGSDILAVWPRGLGWSSCFLVRGRWQACSPGSGCAGLAGGVLVSGGWWCGERVWSGRGGEAGEGGFPPAFPCSGREAGG